MAKEEIKPLLNQIHILNQLHRLSEKEIEKKYPHRFMVIVDEEENKRIHDYIFNETFVSGEKEMMGYYDITTTAGEYRIIWCEDGKHLYAYFNGIEMELGETLKALYERRKPQVESVFRTYLDVIDFINKKAQYDLNRVSIIAWDDGYLSYNLYTDRMTKDTLKSSSNIIKDGKKVEKIIITIDGHEYKHIIEREKEIRVPIETFYIDDRPVDDELTFIKRFDSRDFEGKIRR